MSQPCLECIFLRNDSRCTEIHLHPFFRCWDRKVRMWELQKSIFPKKILQLRCPRRTRKLKISGTLAIKSYWNWLWFMVLYLFFFKIKTKEDPRSTGWWYMQVRGLVQGIDKVYQGWKDESRRSIGRELAFFVFFNHFIYIHTVDGSEIRLTTERM